MTKGMKKAFKRIIAYSIITIISFFIGTIRADLNFLMIIPTISILLLAFNYDSYEKLEEKEAERKARFCPIKK